jgi:Flp pilus assembly CpaE family ATPase
VVHRTKRILDLLRASGADSEKIKVLFNRYAPEEKDVLMETEDALKLKTSLVIPNDYLACSGAINSGTPLVLSVPKSPISRAFSDIVKSLGHGGDEENGNANANWVGRLRGLMVGRPKVRQAKASLTFP